MNNELSKAIEPLRQALQHWWQERAPREQQVLQVLGLVVGIFLVYSLFWHPVMKARAVARADYRAARQTYDWIKANEHAIQSARQASSPQTGGDWIANINQSASNAGLALKGFTPQGTQSVSVVLEKQSFAAVLNWLATLKQQNNVLPSNVEISAVSDPGLVNVQVTLTGGS